MVIGMLVGQVSSLRLGCNAKVCLFSLLPPRFAYTKYNHIDRSAAYQGRITVIDYSKPGSE